jgi:hypothetical protein
MPMRLRIKFLYCLTETPSSRQLDMFADWPSRPRCAPVFPEEGFVKPDAEFRRAVTASKKSNSHRAKPLDRAQDRRLPAQPASGLLFIFLTAIAGWRRQAAVALQGGESGR